jgi:hypothetical protein
LNGGKYEKLFFKYVHAHHADSGPRAAIGMRKIIGQPKTHGTTDFVSTLMFRYAQHDKRVVCS